MIKIQSETDKRIIVKGRMNGKPAFMLVDTGAVAGIINKRAEKTYGLDVDRKRPMEMVGAGGQFKAYLVKDPFEIGGKQVYQFCLADISGVVNSIHQETGIFIAGIISLGQCKMLHISIDTDDHYITIE